MIIFPQNKDLIVRTNIRVQDLTSGENLPLSFAFVLPEKRLNRDTQLTSDFETAILHYIDGVGRKYNYSPYWAPSLRDSAQYGIYFLPTSRQYNAELPPQNRNWFIMF